MARLTCALGPDNAGRLMVEALQHAADTVDASFYEVGDAYIWALVAAARRGVIVRLVVDPRSDPEMRQRAVTLAQNRVECRLLSQPDSRAHAKLVVLDKACIAVGSGNLNGRDLPFRHDQRNDKLSGTREWWVMAEGVPTLARVARAHVMRNWRAASPALGVAADDTIAVAPPIHPLADEVERLEIELSPRRLRLSGGGAGVRTMEQEILNGVRRRALVTVPYVSAAAPAVAPLLGALTAHARRGLDVRLLLGEPPTSDSDIAVLNHIEADVRVMDSAHVAGATTGHAKGLVCDDIAVVGSANWSEAGLSGNDEAAIAISHPDAANYYAAAFDRDWETAVPLP